MKQMSENQLRSWRPRRPSAGLKRRLLQFAGEDEVPTARWLWSCVAPTMACALLTLMAFSHDGTGLGPKMPMALIKQPKQRRLRHGRRADRAESSRGGNF